MQNYIHATSEAGKAFYQKFQGEGKIVMLNLLKFRALADYTNLEVIKPAQAISGSAAYQLYMKYTQPLLKKVGSRLLFYGDGGHFLIGPTTETWDLVLLVEHESVTKFLEMARGEEYLKIAGHRTAALEDSRLLPIVENSPHFS